MLLKVTKHILSYLKFAENICFEMMEIDPRKVLLILIISQLTLN